MGDVRLGRVLVASVHQAIADLLPTRLGFYENWLDAESLRAGTIGLAPFYAVLSFLRLEGEPYRLITARAGEYAAEWTVDSMAQLTRTIVKRAPARVRRRMVLVLARRFVRATYPGSRAITELRRGVTNIDVRASVFCNVRDTRPQPLCGFYAAAFTRMQSLFGLPGTASMISCRGAGGAGCVMRMDPDDTATPSATWEAV